MTGDDLKFAAELRSLIDAANDLEGRARFLTPSISSLSTTVEFGEVNAQVMLAVRALEDAQDRLARAAIVAGLAVVER